ncbi:helix-turn-helix domain-containing protein [Muricoccus radiodurans]|uniref:helix-turn-helix domain-containing protein n=1 Tax=Muricoccus radiodurans TaxID=2231721 RepID=UPI003CFBBB91
MRTHDEGQPVSGDKRPNDSIDAHVGSRVRQQRILIGMTQAELGLALGLTYQQVQKYERGTNRLSVQRLVDLARALNVSVGYFVDDDVRDRSSLHEGNTAEGGDAESGSEWHELRDVYGRIRDADVRKGLLGLAKTMADGDWARGLSAEVGDAPASPGNQRPQRKRRKSKE